MDQRTRDDLAVVRTALRRASEPWQKSRLRILESMLRSERTTDEVAKVHGVSRRTAFNYWRAFREDGLDGILNRRKSTGRPPTLKGTRKQEFEAKVRRGTFESTGHAQVWIEQRTGKALTRRGVSKIINRSRERLDSAKRPG